MTGKLPATLGFCLCVCSHSNNILFSVDEPVKFEGSKRSLQKKKCKLIEASTNILNENFA